MFLDASANNSCSSELTKVLVKGGLTKSHVACNSFKHIRAGRGETVWFHLIPAGEGNEHPHIPVQFKGFDFLPLQPVRVFKKVFFPQEDGRQRDSASVGFATPTLFLTWLTNVKVF